MRYFFLYERNGKVQLCIAVLVTVLGFGFGVSVAEWMALLLCMALVLCLEMVNSAIEQLCNVVQEDHHPVIKIVKDIAAGAVLFASIITAIVGIVVFYSRIISLL